MKATQVAKAKAAAVVKAAPAPTEPSPEAGPGPAAESRDEFIRRTAYAYYEARGRSHGHELEDWLRAEAEFERIGAAGGAGGDTTTAH